MFLLVSRPGFWWRIITLEPFVAYMSSPLNRHPVERFTADDTRNGSTQRPTKKSPLNNKVSVFSVNPVRKFRQRNSLTGALERKYLEEFTFRTAVTIIDRRGPIRDTGSWCKPQPDTFSKFTFNLFNLRTSFFEYLEMLKTNFTETVIKDFVQTYGPITVKNLKNRTGFPKCVINSILYKNPHYIKTERSPSSLRNKKPIWRFRVLSPLEVKMSTESNSNAAPSP